MCSNKLQIEYVHGLVTAIHLSNDETSVTGVSVRRANNPASNIDFTCDMVIGSSCSPVPPSQSHTLIFT